MPFFPQAYLSGPEASFFQLLSELDEPKHHSKPCTPRSRQPAAAAQTISPKFDVAEVAQAYELYGEVPGLERSDLTIEFADAQTLVIKGKIERTIPAVAPVTTAASEEPASTHTEVSDTASEKSHNATVEDDYDAADTPLATPATTVTTVAAPEKKVDNNNNKEEQKTETPKPKFWVAERRVGTFARTFSFSQRIEQDAVKAELKNGVLHVVVPKSLKSRQVAVQVY